MTTSQSRNLRKAGAVALSLALAMSTLAITPASAAKKVKLAKTKITVNVGKTKTVKIKNVKKKQVKKLTVKSKSTKIAKAKASKKTAIKVTGKKAGSTKVTANLKLKKKVGGKKAYKLTLKVTVKKAAPVEPTVAPTEAPTATPVVPATDLTLKPNEVTVQVSGAAATIVAELTPAGANEEVAWTIDKTDIAKITASGSAAAIVEGLKEGSATITAKVGNITKNAKVNVTKQVIIPKLQKVDQKKADSIDLTFDIDVKKATTKVTTSSIKVDQLNDKGEVAFTNTVNSIDDKDGNIVHVNLAETLKNTTKYRVTFNKTDVIEFTASVGPVAKVIIDTASAEKGVETPVLFTLRDANDIDVTSTVVVSQTCKFSKVSGAGTAGDFNIKFDKVGDTATVKVAYNSGATGAKDIEGTGVILCVDPQAKIGTKHYKTIGDEGKKTWTGDDSEGFDGGCAKFYAGSDATTITAYKDKETIFYFYAADANGDAINYDGGYTVESSNTRVLTVEGVRSQGRYCAIKIKGVAADSAALNIKCKANGVDAPYNVPVTVNAVTLSDVKWEASLGTSMSDSTDPAYKNKITAKAYAGDLEITDEVDWSFELSVPAGLVDKDGNKKTSVQDFEDGTGDDLKDNIKFFKPGFGEEGSWGVKIIAKYDGKEMSKTFSINVKKLSTHAKLTLDAARVNVLWGTESGKTFITTDAGTYKTAIAGEVAILSDPSGKVKYDIETSGDWNAAKKASATGEVKLVAKQDQGDLFVGYVDSTNKVKDPGYIKYKTGMAQDINNTDKFETSISFRSKAVTGGQNVGVQLYGLTQKEKETTTGSWTTASFVLNSGTCTMVSDLPEYDVDMAAAGDLVVKIKAKVDGKVKELVSKTVKVERDVTVPTVTAPNTRIKNLSTSGIVEALKANIDLNGASTHASISDVDPGWSKTTGKNGAYSFEKKSFDTSDSTKLDVKYAVVDDGIVTFYVGIDTVFHQN